MAKKAKKVDPEFPQRIYVAIDSDEGYLLAGRDGMEVSGAASADDAAFVLAEYELVSTKRVRRGLISA